MLEPKNNDELPAIPGKRYFTIGEVSDLCGVKPHVLRYWEQEFPQLKPVKRRGNRRYYQRQDVIVIRQIRSLLYDQGFTIGGARNKLTGEEARTDVSQSQQIVRQVRAAYGNVGMGLPLVVVVRIKAVFKVFVAVPWEGVFGLVRNVGQCALSTIVCGIAPYQGHSSRRKGRVVNDLRR